jgi:glycerol-3-phosphate dehydrogenase
MQNFDVVIIGGGINGVGVARDAALRGLSVLLLEKDDLSLAERERLLHIAPHLIRPMQFVLPHEPHYRPLWLMQLGLALYDNLSLLKGVRMSLPGSKKVKIKDGGLKANFASGLQYSDAQVDDARLVVATAMSAREAGAQIVTKANFTEATKQGDDWLISYQLGGKQQQASCRALINTAGPWVGAVSGQIALSKPSKAQVKHVKGSHIVVPRVHSQEHAYILQNKDGRIVFMIPYEQDFTLIGTTDISVTEYEAPVITQAEIDYLLALSNHYLAKPLTQSDIVWQYSGVRPLYDDGEKKAQKVTRDYVIKRSDNCISLYGGKLTTHRACSEEIVDLLKPLFPKMKRCSTALQPISGGEKNRQQLQTFATRMQKAHPDVPSKVLAGLIKRHGSSTEIILANAIGATIAGDVCEGEVRWMREQEWATTAADVLWRRSKLGLQLKPAELSKVTKAINQLLAS